MTALSVPVDGRLTSQNILSGPLDGTDVMYIVSPGNAAEGNSYQVTLNTLSSFLGGGGGGGRATSDVTYYVNADTGNDNHPGTLSAPFKTQVHAWDTVAAIDGNGYHATIQLQDATALYDGVNLDPNFGNVRLTPFGWRKITMQGNASTPTNTGVSAALTPFGTCYSFSSVGCEPFLEIQNMMLTDGAVGVVDSGSIFVGAFCKVAAQNLYVKNIDLGFSCASEGYFNYEGSLYLYAVDVSTGALISAEGPCTVIFEPSSVTYQGGPNPPNQYAISARNGAFLECFLPDLSAIDSKWDYKFWVDSNAVLYCNSLNNMPGINMGIVTNGGSVHAGPRLTDPGWINQICPSPVLDNLLASALPSTCVQGSMALVTDSTTGHAALSTVVGGGSTIVPVIFIANQWVYLVAV